MFKLMNCTGHSYQRGSFTQLQKGPQFGVSNFSNGFLMFFILILVPYVNAHTTALWYQYIFKLV